MMTRDLLRSAFPSRDKRTLAVMEGVMSRVQGDRDHQQEIYGALRSLARRRRQRNRFVAVGCIAVTLLVAAVLQRNGESPASTNDIRKEIYEASMRAAPWSKQANQAAQLVQQTWGAATSLPGESSADLELSMASIRVVAKATQSSSTTSWLDAALDHSDEMLRREAAIWLTAMGEDAKLDPAVRRRALRVLTGK